MKATDLIQGERYILTSGVTATYVRKQTGDQPLSLADGSTLLLNSTVLVFHSIDHDPAGPPETILVESGADVTEPESTKLAREAAYARFQADKAAAVAEAIERTKGVLASLGAALETDAKVVEFGYHGEYYSSESVLSSNVAAVDKVVYRDGGNELESGWIVHVPLALLESIMAQGDS